MLINYSVNAQSKERSSWNNYNGIMLEEQKSARAIKGSSRLETKENVFCHYH